MSRLPFAPGLSEVRITDISAGIGVFTPKPDKPVSFAALHAALRRAGYTLSSAEITLVGTLARDASGWYVTVAPSGQRFNLEGVAVGAAPAGVNEGDRVEVVGNWRTLGERTDAREVISPRTIRSAPATSSASVNQRTSQASFNYAKGSSSNAPLTLFAPIRTTSPGLTVYRGGAVTPRLSFTRQHLGNLEVNRQSLQLAVSYTPTPRLQLEAELSYSRSSFDDGVNSGEGSGFGNIILWSKYRFYREVGIWGDRQAAVRFGLELPTGSNTAPSEQELPASAFVREQLTPISGGFAAHADLAYSRARGRLIYGANVEGVWRSERDGFRTGHELRINTDTEYIIFPFRYRRPTGELFAILETNFIHRGRGRFDGAQVPESGSTEFYLAPGLQYVATSRLVVEGSAQLPVARSSGAQVLRTDYSLLFGIRYLF